MNLGFIHYPLKCEISFLYVFESILYDLLGQINRSSIGLLCLAVYVEGILPKGPYLPCVSMVSMAGRALLAGYHRCFEPLTGTTGIAIRLWSRQISRALTYNLEYDITASTKWSTFSRRHFEIHILELKLLYIDSNSSEALFLWAQLTNSQPFKT